MAFSFFRRMSIAALAAVALAGPGEAQPLLTQHRDYRIPPSSQVRAATVRIPGGKAFGSGERVSYAAFDGKTYELNRFHGRYVDVLLPDSWLEPGVFSEELVYRFADRADLIYQRLLDLVGVPPAGDGPLSIAVVPNACNAVACANLGLKGIELTNSPGYGPIYRDEIAQDFPSGVLVHEMTHNFDAFHQYLGYTRDYPHGWTDFISFYYYPYTHDGREGQGPEEITRKWLATTRRYFQDPQVDWASCVRDDGCEDRYLIPELAWGGFGFRIGLLDGPQAVRGFMRFLTRYRQSNPPGETPEEKNDLYVEALAAGTRHNLSCVSDSLHWRISDSLRQRMRQLYGAQNPDCQDGDHDGFSRLQGDCDERRATVHPGAVERINRLDDDCDGRVDEAALREPAGGDFADPRQLTVPADVRGTAGGGDLDEYRFHLASPRRLSFELCAPPGEGNFAELFLYDSSGALSEDLYMYTRDECKWMVFPLEAGEWNLRVDVDILPAGTAYSFAVQDAPPWPLPPWARTAPPRQSGDRFVLSAPTSLSRLPVRPNQVRFWVSGAGVVGTVPYGRAAAFTWAPPTGVDPVALGLTYRAEILADGVPAYTIIPPQPFSEP
ncbi:MAG: putative metal-binding motif-containing protein [Thermoanaerobaculia bacterium]